jgi:hypothetical protein
MSVAVAAKVTATVEATSSLFFIVISWRFGGAPLGGFAVAGQA